MSRLGVVIKNKHKVDRARKERRKNELSKLRTEAEFRARLAAEMQNVNILLNDPSIKSVQIKILPKYVSQFSTAIYSEDLTEYSITQDKEDAEIFNVSKKYLQYA